MTAFWIIISFFVGLFIILTLLALINNPEIKAERLLRKSLRDANRSYRRAEKSDNQIKKSLEKMIDPEEIRKVAKTAPSTETRIRAASKINDWGILTDIVLDKEQTNHVRKLALNEIQDQEMLTLIADKIEKEDLRMDVIQKMTNLNVLEKIAGEDDSPKIRMVAYMRLPYFNNELYNSMMDVFWCKNVKVQREAANRIIELLRKRPKEAHLFWNFLTERCKDHYDRSHLDQTGASDCHHDYTDYHPQNHQDTGIGVQFPHYPFND